MSQDMSERRCEKGAEIEMAGPFARHADACDVCTRESTRAKAEEKTADTALDALKFAEIPDLVRAADVDGLARLVAASDYTPAKSDTPESAAAKAMIDEKSGGKDAYAVVFGRCAEDTCEYGANGFEREYCRGHQE